jgi:radical SAM superfamily enzyme YgiQ (UPF0313 family)
MRSYSNRNLPRHSHIKASKKKLGFRVLLISSSFEKEWRSKTINQNSHYPLGLGYLHSYLEKEGYTLKTLFLNDYPGASCLRRVKQVTHDWHPAVVGFNMLTNNRVSSFRLIEFVHDTYPYIHILIGGIHATLMHDQIIERYPFVISVNGEGEITTAKLLHKLLTQKSYRYVQGISFWSKSKVITTRRRNLIRNLDALPFPKHEAFFTRERTIASILTSRGCPFRCSFCVLESISRRIYRKRSVQDVISEIQHLTSSFPQLETIWIHDDQFFIDNQRVIDLCNEIVKRKVHLKFICSGRFKPVSKELVDAIVKAGFIEVLFGLESGSTKILRLCHKMITKRDVIRTLKLFRNKNIFVVTFLIIGLHGETDATVKESYTFIQKMQKIKYIYFGDIGTLTIYPGTEIYDIAKNAHIIDDSYWMTDNATPLFTLQHSLDELAKYKSDTLDHISLLQFATPKGFVAQYAMTPFILKFFISNISNIPLISTHLIQRFYPHLYMSLRKLRFITT